MSKNHPSKNLLRQFASGNIDDQLAVLVSAHISTCKVCNEFVYDCESRMGEEFFSDETTNASANFEAPSFVNMATSIVQCHQDPVKTEAAPANESLMKYVDKEVDLPSALVPLKKFMSSWRTAGNVHYSTVDLHGEGKMYFLYFEPGAKIPEHTHRGHEYSYVVAGSFRDQHSEYISGDFACFDESDSHKPYTDDPDGCLLLVSIDGRFHFKEGIAKILNPFGKFIFGK